MMTNSEIADQLSLLSKLMDIHGENSFKTRAYATAAFNIDRLYKQVSEIDDAELFNTRGIGKSIGEQIRELMNTGKLQVMEEIIAVTPPGILEMLEIKGLGPKKIAEIWRELGIESVGELEYACNENRLVTLKGFGVKTQESILQNIAYIRQNAGWHLYADALKMANLLLTHLSGVFPNYQFLLTGSMRRQNDTIESIELVTNADREKFVKYLQASPNVTLSTLNDEYLVMTLTGFPAIKIYLSNTSLIFNTLFLTTGNDTFLEAFTSKYNLPETPVSEEEIFSINNLEFIAPAMRETAEILSLAEQHALPQLIQTADIKGIIHCHSTWSDGSNSLEEMANAAIKKGLEYMVISDHSQAATYAKGLTPERVAAQHAEIDTLNSRLAPFKIFKSIEADILGTGELDYYPELLSTFDIVIASVHSNLKMSQDKAMERVLTAIRNPYTSILGHPTGRLLLSRKGYPLDFKAIIDACAENNVVIEINAHPRRLDLDWQWITYAMQQKVLLSIDPDAHFIEGFEDIHYGVLSAQKGGLTKVGNLSSFSLGEMERFIVTQQQKRRG